MADMPAIPDLSERLSDGVVELREGSEWDIPEILIAHEHDPQLHVRLGLRRPPSGAQLGQAAERAAADRASGARISLTIVEPGSHDCCGRIEVGPIDWGSAAAQLQVWVAPQLRGRGLARRALALAAAWLFEEVGVERVLLDPGDPGDPADQPLIRAATAAGFSREGVSFVLRARDPER